MNNNIIEPEQPGDETETTGTEQTTNSTMDFVQKRKYWIIGALAVFIGVLGFTSYYSAYLSARVAPGLQFNILGPAVLTQGEPATITWDISTAAQKLFPTEKIEYCYGKKGKSCVTLVEAAANVGTASIVTPVNLPVGTGFFKFTARDARKKLLKRYTTNSGAVTVQAAKVTEENKVDQEPPAPYAPYAPYGGKPTPTPEPEPRVSLSCPPSYVDVNGDGSVTSADSDLVTNYINGNRADIAKTGATWQNQINPADVNADGSVTPSDVLIVVNQVNRASGIIESANCLPPPSPYAAR